MRVIVLGAGVVGATTAYTLAREGHEVTVLERREGPGLETSFANGGQISASHAEPWASPAALGHFLRWFGRKDAPLYFPLLRFDPALWRWSLRFLGQCTEGRARDNMTKALRLALYSREALKALRAETGIRYEHQSRGILHFYRDQAGFDRAREIAEAMGAEGLVRHPLTPEECLAMEPALATVMDNLAGGLYSPEDESGDAYLFTKEITRLAEEAGAVFHFNREVISLQDEALQKADRTVLCLGSFSGQLGLKLPLYPAKGYSITLDVPEDATAPTVSLTDEENKMVFSRLGNRLRAAGTAEFSGWDTTLNLTRADLIRDKTKALFPEAGDYGEPHYWCGLRPTTPDSLPIIGAAPGIPGLILNTGHGTLGWTMAVGSAKIVASLIGGRKPEIDVAGLGLERF